MNLLNSITNKTIISFLWLLSGGIGKLTIKLLFLAVLVRLISPHDFGIIAAATIVYGIANILVNIGVGPALIQKRHVSEEDQSSAWVMSIVLGVLISLAIYSFRESITLLFGVEELRDVLFLVAITVLIKSFSVVHESMAAKELNFKRIAYADILAFLCGYGIVSSVLAFNGFGYWSVVIGVASQEAIRTLIILRGSDVKITGGFSPSSARKLFNFGSGNTIGQIANYVANQIDQVMVSKFSGAEMLGFYSRAYQLSVMPTNVLGSAVHRVLFSGFSLIQSSDSQLQQSYYKSLRMASISALSIAPVFYFLSDDIVAVVLGKGWEAVVPIFEIMSLGLVIRLVNKINDSVVKAKGAVHRRAIIQIFYAISAGGLCFVAIDFGVDKVAVAFIISMIINFFLMTVLVKRTIAISYFEVIKSVSRGGVICLILILALSASGQIMQAESFSHLETLAIDSAIAVSTILVSIWMIPKLCLGPELEFYRAALRKVLCSVKGTNR